MKILRIAGRNLASLAGDFCVDFESEPLASSGLFAISGPTGAGKSTLLDALCLALYGNTPRLQGRGSRGALPDAGGESVSTLDARNLLRRGAAEGHAEVDFVGNDGVHYRARWSVRRSRNRVSGLLQASNMTLHRLPELAPLGGTKTEVAGEIAARIGLSFEQFTRSVLLAQNEFSAFLKTDENERGELLETLTGSAVYSEISKRAYERYKQEQDAVRRLSSRLADHAPLAQEAREQLDAERAAAEVALQAVDVRRALLEAQLRWHQESERLRQGEAQAQAQLEDAQSQVAAAQERRVRLATLDEVQAARPLMTELARLDAERVQVEATLANGQGELARAVDAARQAVQEVQDAAAALEAAEAAQLQAAAQLDSAKALDATIATLAGAHTQLASRRDEAAADGARARALLEDAQARLAQTRQAAARSAEWLAAYSRHETLALQWPRWDKLFHQAAQAAAAEEASLAALAKAERARVNAAATAQAAQDAAERAAARIAELDSARQDATKALAGFDLDALQSERAALEARREAPGHRHAHRQRPAPHARAPGTHRCRTRTHPRLARGGRNRTGRSRSGRTRPGSRCRPGRACVERRRTGHRGQGRGPARRAGRWRALPGLRQRSPPLCPSGRAPACGLRPAARPGGRAPRRGAAQPVGTGDATRPGRVQRRTPDIARRGSASPWRQTWLNSTPPGRPVRWRRMPLPRASASPVRNPDGGRDRSLCGSRHTPAGGAPRCPGARVGAGGLRGGHHRARAPAGQRPECTQRARRARDRAQSPWGPARARRRGPGGRADGARCRAERVRR
ncbi:AAA family ATPase [Massilia sp. Dwa41.01b]|uniref:AAA family ATPase n=1 Tax=Massilia sp. Dwa41.01b TaxID=2709302 RepID=UPI0015FFAEF2|nr:AAA family ATPase [Massilia sp. Dwa41.01b]QNA89575.1 AAA family ATPase [Massilia sp. Dwa41.01b]